MEQVGLQWRQQQVGVRFVRILRRDDGKGKEVHKEEKDRLSDSRSKEVAVTGGIIVQGPRDGKCGERVSSSQVRKFEKLQK